MATPPPQNQGACRSSENVMLGAPGGDYQTALSLYCRSAIAALGGAKHRRSSRHSPPTIWANPQSPAAPPMIQLSDSGALNHRSTTNVNAKQMPAQLVAIPSVAMSQAVSFSTCRDMVAVARQRAE